MKSDYKNDASPAPEATSRRQVLKGLAAGSLAAAGGLAPSMGFAAERTRQWKAEADVVVVGTGMAGTAAALGAAQAGASVLLLDKMPFKGGTMAKSGGVFWIPNNAYLREQGVPDERADAMQYMVRLSYPTRYVPDHPTLGVSQFEYDLIAAYYDNASVVLDKLIETTELAILPWGSWDGQPFPDYYADLPENKVGRGRSLVCDVSGHPDRVIWRNNGGGGESVLWHLRKSFDKLGIKELLDHRVLSLVQNPGGRVEGVVVDNGGNAPIDIRANKAVVFGTGGFTHNVNLARQFLKGHIWGGCAAPSSTGDFIPIAMAAGAALGNMTNAWWGQVPVEVALKTPSVPADIWSTPGDSVIQVNRYGERFVNEKIQYDERTQTHFTWDPVDAEYPNLLSFMIWDSRTSKLYAGYDPVPAADAKIDHVIEGATLQELAANIKQRLATIAEHTGAFKLDDAFLDNLHATIKRFNPMAKSGKDEDFSRGETPIEIAFQFLYLPKVENDYPNVTMHPISDKGPYYAVILGAGTLDTKGGAVVNPQGQVLDNQKKPIAGLYAAGNCVAHPAAQAYWAGGGTIGPAMTFGYMAGEAAATETVKSKA